MVAELTGSNKAILKMVDEIGPAVKGLTEWMPEVERSVGELKGEIHQLREQVSCPEKMQPELSEDDKKAVKATLKGFDPSVWQASLAAPLLPTSPQS